MRKILLLIFVGTILWGCKSSDDATSTQPKSLTISNSEFEWDTNVRQQALSITAEPDSAWTISSNVNWCSPMKSSGEGSYNLSLWVSPNITTEARSGVLTLTCNKTTHNISISQPAYSSDTDYVYHIPLVFHVMYKDSLDTMQNIKKGWLAKVVNVVNRFYKYNNTNIQFEMAQIDEDGDTLNEPGIIRHKVTFSSYDCDKFLDTSDKTYGTYSLNMKRYLNVYVFRFTDSSTMGVSDIGVVPTAYSLEGATVTDEGNDITTLPFPFGCCINNEYIYETEDDGYYNPCFIVVTLAHELGHYLGLLHTFSADECNDDDYCTDTHDCDYTAYTESLDSLYNALVEEKGEGNVTLDDVSTRNGCDGEDYIADNIMDYAYCLSDTMTAQQIARTKHVLNYGSLIPGPKLIEYSVSSKTRSNINFKPIISSCPPIPNIGEETRGKNGRIKILLH